MFTSNQSCDGSHSLFAPSSAHQLGNSIGVLRQYYNLGVRYVTLAHFCHNAFADSCGFEVPIEPLHRGLRYARTFFFQSSDAQEYYYISPLGRSLIEEMNRLGILVDLSHTSDSTASQALNYSRAPVIWSHSSARSVYDASHNIPDDVLRLIGFGEGQRDAVVMVSYSFVVVTQFITCSIS